MLDPTLSIEIISLLTVEWGSPTAEQRRADCVRRIRAAHVAEQLAANTFGQLVSNASDDDIARYEALLAHSGEHAA